MLNNWHKKEKPFAGFAGFGGGATGLGLSGSSGTPSDGYYLVYSFSDTGSATAPNFKDFGTVTGNETGSEGVSCTRYSQIDPSWTRIWFCSETRGHVWVFDNDSSTQSVLESLCNNYADWPIADNGTVSVGPTWGSSRYGTTGSQKSMVFQHNNGGGESHDIVTLGNSANIWNTGMYWGNIDSTSNHGGLMNIYDPHTGSGGSNTGDRLFVYLEYGAAGNASNYTNYLTPNGPLGDARNFTWTHSTNSNAAGSPSYLADAVSNDGTIGGWDNYGFQQNANDAWIAVDLGSGNEQAFSHTFAIGHDGGSHWSQFNRIEASNNYSSWTMVAEWQMHANDNQSDYNAGYLIYPNGGHVYSNTINNVGKWIAIRPGPAYRYWRIRGTNFGATNSYQLLTNWALLKKNT